MQPEAKRPRVAIISQGLGWIRPPEVSGSVSIWTYEVSRLLADRCSLLLVELGTENFRKRTLAYEGVTYVYVPQALNRIANALHRRAARIMQMASSRERRLRRPQYASVLHFLPYILQAAWQARRWRSNVIHIHNFTQFVPVVRALNPKARIVLHMHCEWLSQLDRAMIGRRVAKADAVICCSKYLQEQFLAVFPEYRSKAHVVFNGANVEQFLPSGNVAANGPSQQLRIVFVGRVSPEKGIHVLVDAFAKIAEDLPQATLDVIGPFDSLPRDFLVGLSRDPHVQTLEQFYQVDYLSEVKRRIPKALADRVVLHGAVPYETVAEHYRHATIYAGPSFSDTFHMPAVEAMASSVPVVASKVGGIPEVVVDGRTGYLVEPGNVDALAAALRRLLEDGALRERLGAAGRARALELFSWQAINREVVRVYFGDLRKNI
jgi:spore coat protein SA